MNDFPLNPFLASLAAAGIRLAVRDYERIHLALQAGGPWTITRFRDTLLALLVKDEDQRDIFLRRFDDFFQLEPGAGAIFGEIDLQRALADLEQLAQQPGRRRRVPDRPQRPRPPIRKLVEKPRRIRWWTLVSIVLVLGMVGAILYLLTLTLPFDIGVFSVREPGWPLASVWPIPTVEPKRLYTDVPYVANSEYVRIRSSTAGQPYAALALFLLCAALLYGLWLWRKQKVPQDQAAKWDKTVGARHFPLASIGGQPAPLLDDETLAQLADSMGYFQSRQGGRALNVLASIETTLRQGGIPALEFYKRKEIRSLLILEDAFAEAGAWNPIARELAAGMARRGVPVLYGRFQGSPDQFKTETGSVYRLEDLEDERPGYLLLIFSDGKGLSRHESAFALEALARWPMVAWLELREARFWDETAALPLRYDLPIYPATPTGLLQAVKRFLTEQGAASDFSTQALDGRGLPVWASGAWLEAYVEELLGDALPWAQDCVWLQPLSPGLADALRRTFHSYLPPERIERLYALPGTRHNVSGLRFSAEVQSVLRQGFITCRDDQAQEEVLNFVLRAVEGAEPDQPAESLAHLAWENVRERLRLELDPDNDLARLAQLAQTPLGDAISASLENFSLPEPSAAPAAGKIPLRLKPRHKDALQRLARISDLPIPKLEQYPLARGHWLALVLLVVVGLVCAGWSLTHYLDEPELDSNWQVVGLEDTYARLERKDDADAWYLETAGPVGTLTGQRLEPEATYRLTLYGGDHRTTTEITATHDSLLQTTLAITDVEYPCREEFPAMGLTVVRCPDFENDANQAVPLTPWREKFALASEPAPGDRLLSVGLEISGLEPDDRTLRRWHNTLLQSGSIDLLYRIRPDNNEEAIAKALGKLQADLAPWIERSQLIWWAAGPILATVMPEDPVPEFDRRLKLGQGEDLSWIARLEDLLSPGETMLVSEQEIRQALGQEVEVISSPVALIRLTTTPTMSTFKYEFGPTLYDPKEWDTYTQGDNVVFKWERFELLNPAQFYSVSVVLDVEPEVEACIHAQVKNPPDPARDPEIYFELNCPPGAYYWSVVIVTELPEGSEHQWREDSEKNQRNHFSIGVPHPNIPPG